MKKLTCATAALTLGLMMCTGVAMAAEEPTMTISVRIEGVTENVYQDTVKVPYTDTLTAQQVFSYVDEQNPDLTITGVEYGYITAVNDESAAMTATGWDGFMYRVNGAAQSVGIDAYEMQDQDSLVLFYSDEYVTGMQYPNMDTSQITEGILSFTSMDTTYDESYNPVTTENPVTGATVTWETKGETVTYVTDEKGQVMIASDLLTPGTHEVSIEKYSSEGIPMVLRLPKNTLVTVEAEDSSNNGADSADRTKTIPYIILLCGGILVMTGCAVAKKRN